MERGKARSMDALSLKSGYSTASISTSQVLGGVLTNILGSLFLLLSSPVLIFGGFIFIYFYHIQNFDIVSSWFYVLPYLFFSCGAFNFIASILIPVFQALEVSFFRKVFTVFMSVFLIAACALNGVSAYGSSELHSMILQNNILSVNPAEIIEQYMTDQVFKSSWDNLQRQYFCCGALLFNTGYMDWKSSFGKFNNSVPDSCCHVESEDCGRGIYSGSQQPPLSIYHHGCMTVIQSKLATEVAFLLVVFMVISVSMMMISLICLILSLCTSGRRSQDVSSSTTSRSHYYYAHSPISDTDHLRTDGRDDARSSNQYAPTPSDTKERETKKARQQRNVDLFTTQVSSEV